MTTRPRPHRDYEELLGAYALDAVDGDEADEVAAHLGECARCRAEVSDHREVAALLAHGGTDAPDGVWDRIAAAIEGTGPADGAREIVPAPALLLPQSRRSARVWPTRVLAPVVAAAAAVIAVLGVQVVSQGNRLAEQGDRIEALASEDGLNQAFQAAIADPDAEMVDLRSEDGQQAARAVVAGGTGYLHAASLPELPEGRTYQLWGVAGDSVISLGVLGPRPTVAMFAMSEDVQALAVTEEEGSGVVVSDQPPVVAATMPSDA